MTETEKLNLLIDRVLENPNNAIEIENINSEMLIKEKVSDTPFISFLKTQVSSAEESAKGYLR